MTSRSDSGCAADLDRRRIHPHILVGPDDIAHVVVRKQGADISR